MYSIFMLELEYRINPIRRLGAKGFFFFFFFLGGGGGGNIYIRQCSKSTIIKIPLIIKVMIFFQRKHRWENDLIFYVLFNGISVISGRWADDNERLCVMEPRLHLR